jgi:hypothetical protein
LRGTRERDGQRVSSLLAYCEQRVPPNALHQVRVEADVGVAPLPVTECRAPWREDFAPEWTRRGIACVRYTAKHGHLDAVLERWHQRRHNYDLVAPTRDVLALLDELDRDPTCGRVGGQESPPRLLMSRCASGHESPTRTRESTRS